jgi:hypothetical protein
MNPTEYQEIPFEEKKNGVPLWLLLSYVALLTWSIWNLIRYWQ